MYKIKIDYRTGNSFNTYNREDYLEGTWQDLSVATQNIERIKQHYEWYEAKSSTYRASPKIPAKPDFVADEYSLKLLLDNGNEYSISPFWVGYFETLYEASIKQELPKYSRR